MKNESPFVITIKRQLGSGGAYLGQRLANRLNIRYLDREILYHAAQELKISEEDLRSHDERVTPRWQAWIEAASLGYSQPFVTPITTTFPTDMILYEAESKVIRSISKDHSAVIVGRAGFHILRDHPRHLSVFLHADIAFRQQRVQELNHISESEALQLINRTERERARYLREFTKQDGMDASRYHLCLNTSAIGFESAENIILTALQGRLGIAAPQEEKPD
jgi:cytidylate kinase